jgi:hypothetical protein
VPSKGCGLWPQGGLSCFNSVLWYRIGSPLAALRALQLDMDRSLDDLVAERGQLQAELADTAKKIKHERRAAKDKAQSLALQWQLTPRLMKVSLIIYMLAEYRAAPAIKFLHVTARKKRWPAKSDEEVERVVGDLFVETDLEELGRMCDLEQPDDPGATQEAVRYVEEWRAFNYVLDLNTRLGVAPSTADVLQKLEANRLHVPSAVRPLAKGTAAEVKARMWARRWRQRWGARHGKVRISDEVPLAERRSKAPLFDTRGVSFRVAGGPKIETICWLTL